MRRTAAYAAMTKDEAQRHLKVINSIRTFYEAVKLASMGENQYLKTHRDLLRGCLVIAVCGQKTIPVFRPMFFKRDRMP